MDSGPRQEQTPLHPPKGPKLGKELRYERKALAGRYYQLLSGHAATGDYLCNKIHKLASERCWWCGQDERQTRHHLFVNCAAWKPQIKELWKDVGYLCGWKHPRTLRMALLFGDERATKAVLSFLQKTKVGQIVTIPPRDGGREGEEGGEDGSRVERDEVEGEEGGSGPPPGCLKGRGRGWAVSRAGCEADSAFLAVGGVFSPSLSLCLFAFMFLFSSGRDLGGRKSRCPALTAGPCISVRRNVVWGQDWGGE